MLSQFDLIRGVYGGLPPPPLSPFGAVQPWRSPDFVRYEVCVSLMHLLFFDLTTSSDAVATAVESCVCNAASSLLNSSHVKQVIGMYECLNNNTLGQIWSNSMSHLFPFIVEYRLKVEIHFSLIAAAVTYVMWKNVGKAKAKREIGMKSLLSGDDTLDSRKRGHFRVDCQSSSKGLFLGLLCLVGGIVVLIIFYVMKEHVDDKEQLYMMYGVTQVTIVALGAVAAFLGLFQLPRLALSGKKPMDLDRLLASTVVIGVYVFAIFGVIVGLSNIDDLSHSLLVGLQGAQILQVSLQSLVITDAARRFCSTRHQMLTKPGRQVITFLVFANATLWLMDTFMAHDAVTQGLQARFFGHLTWGVLSRRGSDATETVNADDDSLSTSTSTSSSSVGIVANPLFVDEDLDSADWNGRIQLWRRPVSRRRLVESVASTSSDAELSTSTRTRRRGDGAGLVDDGWFLLENVHSCCVVDGVSSASSSAKSASSRPRSVAVSALPSTRTSVGVAAASSSSTDGDKPFKKLPWHANLHLLRTK
ncbi:unnamed protein product [Notodromas monacha]|uniref:Uncharacterized protein n=2 Tax=Notodromas monacha TaxID=399045 RepID=A0A7R9BZW7_9CRUS|nr:unnamed protein product [Notodromas monacha]CAG0923573.1 unnamed protein product [Notodromas monacha]